MPKKGEMRGVSTVVYPGWGPTPDSCDDIEFLDRASMEKARALLKSRPSSKPKAVSSEVWKKYKKLLKGHLKIEKIKAERERKLLAGRKPDRK